MKIKSLFTSVFWSRGYELWIRREIRSNSMHKCKRIYNSSAPQGLIEENKAAIIIKTADDLIKGLSTRGGQHRTSSVMNFKCSCNFSWLPAQERRLLFHGYHGWGAVRGSGRGALPKPGVRHPERSSGRAFCRVRVGWWLKKLLCRWGGAVQHLMSEKALYIHLSTLSPVTSPCTSA